MDIIILWLNFLILYMFSTYLWDIQKNIEVEEKEVQSTEEIKKDRKRNSYPLIIFLFFLNSTY